MAQTAPDTVWLAGDEASLYLQATCQAVWHIRGETPIVRVHPGRENIHFYGALNLRTGQETVMQSSLMNGAASVLFLHKLLLTYPDQPIVLLWNRAPWHRGEPIRALLAAHPRLQLLVLPTAAPDLNPQEHVWKAARQAVSHNHSFTHLHPLADAFEAHLLSTTFPCSLLDSHDYQALCMMFI